MGIRKSLKARPQCVLRFAHVAVPFMYHAVLNRSWMSEREKTDRHPFPHGSPLGNSRMDFFPGAVWLPLRGLSCCS